MKTLNRTIIAIVALSLLAAGFASANNAPEAPVLPSTTSPVPVPTPAPPTEPVSVAAANVRLQLDRLLAEQDRLSSRSGSTGTVLVIPTGQIGTEEIITINEDMSVMSRIFQKNLDQARISIARSSIFASRHNVLAMLGGGRGQIQSMYLQDYGALFLMKVDFPLSPSSEAQQEEEQTQEEPEGDPVWQEMRQEMYEPHKVDRRRKTDQQGEKFNAEKVEDLKTTLIKVLKHAANIRSLKPDESVILMITGSSETGGTIIASARRLPGENQVLVQQKSADGKMVNRIVQGSELDSIGSATPSILVIRAKRSDIDDFAKGDLDLDQFRKRVQLLTYPLLSGADSGNRDPFGVYYGSRSTGSSNRR
jgi:hypothetical protein